LGAAPGHPEACVARGGVLTITTKDARRYHAEVLLPDHVDAKSVKSSYNNGVFELRFDKAKAS
jgi:HSP20 family molecular chaperone IbpA